MVLGVREKGQVHSRSQRTSRRQQELGIARLLVKFYQTWGARLFASASPYLRLIRLLASFLQNLFFSGAKYFGRADLTLSTNDVITNASSAI